MAQKVQPHEAHKVDVVLVNYYPSQVQFIPEPLPPSTELLPWEKRAEKDRQREEARKKQLQSAKKKTGNIFSSIGSAVATVASAAVDAVQMVAEDFTDNQSASAVARFHRFFPGFPQETLLGEYPAKFVISPTSYIYGRFYVTSTFFCFEGEQASSYCLFMMALKSIESIQKCITTRPPVGTPNEYPPQFNIVPGGNAPTHDPNDPMIKYPKMDGFVVYTSDRYQHMFYNIKHYKECYNVLDHAWRDPNPVYQPPPQNPLPSLPPPQPIGQSFPQSPLPVVPQQQQQIYQSQPPMPSPLTHQLSGQQHYQSQPPVEFPAIPQHSLNYNSNVSINNNNNINNNNMANVYSSQNYQFPPVPQHAIPSPYSNN